MSDYDLDQLKRLLKEATPGPWRWANDLSSEGAAYVCEQEEAGIIIAKCEGYNYDRNGNGKDAVHAALIAAAINALPALLRDAEVGRRLRSLRENIRIDMPGPDHVDMRSTISGMCVCQVCYLLRDLLSAIDGAKGEGQ